VAGPSLAKAFSEPGLAWSSTGWKHANAVVRYSYTGTHMKSMNPTWGRVR